MSFARPAHNKFHFYFRKKRTPLTLGQIPSAQWLIFLELLLSTYQEKKSMFTFLVDGVSRKFLFIT